MTAMLERQALPVSALVPDEVRDRLAQTIIKDHPQFTAEYAGRLVVEAAKFQAASAARPGVRMAPSKVVDYGWHAWLMNTIDRDALMARIGGVVHHVPELPGENSGDKEAVRRQTLAVMVETGNAPDPELWPAASATCSQCHAGCTDSPNSGK